MSRYVVYSFLDLKATVGGVLVRGASEDEFNFQIGDDDFMKDSFTAAQILDEMHDSSPRDSVLRRLWVFRLSAQVRRMHGLPVHNNQSVGEHTYNAMHIATQLCWANMLPATGAVMRLLFHDVQEVWTGDIPGHVKRMENVRRAVNEAEETFDEALRIPEKPEVHDMTLRGVKNSGCTQMEKDIAKASDVLELLMSCVEERRRGNREQRITAMYWRQRGWLAPFTYITGVLELLDGIHSEWSELQ